MRRVISEASPRILMFWSHMAALFSISMMGGACPLSPYYTHTSARAHESDTAGLVNSPQIAPCHQAVGETPARASTRARPVSTASASNRGPSALFVDGWAYVEPAEASRIRGP